MHLDNLRQEIARLTESHDAIDAFDATKLCELAHLVGRDATAVAIREAILDWKKDTVPTVLLDAALLLSTRNSHNKVVDEGAADSLADPTLALSLAEDIADVSTIRNCELLFAFIEQRSSILTRNMLPSKGKGLVLLRFCNDLLRRLSKTKHTVFCGRILLFLTAAYPLTERSGVNLRGDFNTDNTTVVVEGDDSAMDIDSKSAVVSNYDSKFHKTFWSLQHYFSNPLLALGNPFEWKKMETAVEAVLRVFDAENDAESKKMGSGSTGDSARKRKLDSGSNSKKSTSLKTQDEYFFPKFLTSRNLFDLQLKDISFRRQIMVQMLIIFQFYIGLTKQALESTGAAGVKKSLHFLDSVKSGLSEENEAWVNQTRSRVVKILEQTSPHGRRFLTTLTTVITHEANWIKWKAESCPNFEKSLSDTEKLEVRKRFLEHSQAIDKGFTGSDAMNILKMAETNPSIILQDPLRRAAVKPLEEFLEPLAEQLNEDGSVADGVEDEYLHSKDKTYNWRAYRTALLSHFHIFKEVDNIDTQKMVKKVKFSGTSSAPAAASAATPENK
ncbi:hypothetical protein HDU78_008025 [Chytriomyces hyalinus]|nr:hypothetical protein HDU78_008025 [Chytriomyces hyalinus]